MVLRVYDGNGGALALMRSYDVDHDDDPLINY